MTFPIWWKEHGLRKKSTFPPIMIQSYWAVVNVIPVYPISMIQNFSNIWPFITQIFSASHNCPICCQIVQYCVPKFFSAIYFGKYAEKKSLKVWYFLPSGALPCTAFVIGMAAFGQSMPLFLINNSIIDPLNSTTLHCWPKCILSSCSSSS